MSMRGMARYWGFEWPSLRLKHRRACISRPTASFFGTKPFCRGDETVLKQESEYPLFIRLGRPKMQFIFDLIWTQSCSKYLAAMGQLEGEQSSRLQQLFSR
jgi:hypothetical protein